VCVKAKREKGGGERWRRVGWGNRIEEKERRLGEKGESLFEPTTEGIEIIA